MRDFKPRGGGNRFGGGRSGGFDRRGGGDRERRSFGGDSDREMFDAVCDNCGKSCKVPFRPTGNKPVFCSDCFRKQQDEDGGRDNFRGNRDDREFGDRRPSFGGSNFNRERGNSGGEDLAELKRQMDVLTSKVDRLLKILEGNKAKKSDHTNDITGVEVIASQPKVKKAKKIETEEMPIDSEELA